MQGDLGVGASGVRLDHRRLQPGAQAGERRTQVVGDGVAGVAHAGDRPLQTPEHVVEARRQFVILIAGSAHRRAGGQIARARPIDHPGQAGDVAADIAADQHPAGQAQHDDQGPRAPQGAQDLVHIGFGFADVGADEQDLPAAQAFLQAARRAFDQAAVHLDFGQGEARPIAGSAEIGDRRMGDGAADRRAGLAHQKIQQGPIAGGALDHLLVQGRKAAARVHRLEGVKLTGDAGVGAIGDLAGGGEIDIAQKGAGRGGEQGQKQQGQPKRRGAKQARQAHGLYLFGRADVTLPGDSRRREPSAAWPCRTPCRSSSAGGRCARRSHWSADRSDSSTPLRAAWCG